MSHKGLKFVHVNCRSIYPKLAQIEILFSEYDFISCTETWLTKAYPDSLVSIPDRIIFRSDRSTRGGGVCIYVRSDLGSYCKIDTKSTFSSSDLEIVTVDLTKPGLKHLRICTIYRPPRGDHKRCIDKLTEILS